MGETDTVADILKFVPTINYTTTQKPDDSISLFETNIRYLAGMLSSKCRRFAYFADNQATTFSKAR